MLGHSCHECPTVPGAPAYRAAHAFFGTHAYVVHRRGLQKIFAYPRLYPIEKQIDAGERWWGGADESVGGGRGGAAAAATSSALFDRSPTRPTPSPSPPAVLGDMSSQGLLNVYALAAPLVDQNSRQFKTTIQVPVKWRLGVDAYARE